MNGIHLHISALDVFHVHFVELFELLYQILLTSGVRIHVKGNVCHSRIHGIIDVDH